MAPESQKHFEFTGGAGSFFIMSLVSGLLSIIPLVGFAFSFNYQNGWLAKNLKIDGRNLRYKASFSEAWVLLFVGILLTVVTFGIYAFWFIPKSYRFVLSHVSFADEVPETPAPAAAPAEPEKPAEPTPVPVTDADAPTPPTPPTPPTTLVQ